MSARPKGTAVPGPASGDLAVHDHRVLAEADAGRRVALQEAREARRLAALSNPAWASTEGAAQMAAV